MNRGNEDYTMMTGVDVFSIIEVWSNQIRSVNALIDKIGKVFGNQECEFDDVIMNLVDEYTNTVAKVICPQRNKDIVEFLYWFWIDQEFGKFEKGFHPITNKTVYVHNNTDLAELIVEYLYHV